MAHELLIRGPARKKRKRFMKAIDVNDNTFRSENNGGEIGAVKDRPGARFFDSSGTDSLAFGPGAGLVVGVSIGSESLRAATFDANGAHHNLVTLEPEPDQLKADPKVLLERVKSAVIEVIENSLDDESLAIDGELPLLGVSVAWPSALDREKRPVGNALKNHNWLSSPVDQRVAGRLNLAPERSHAINDVNAAAIAVAFDKTRLQSHEEKQYAHLTAVLRLAGGIGGATVVIEPHENNKSGFLKTILLGGVDSLAGEIGHVDVTPEVIELVNVDLPAGLEPVHPVSCSCSDHGNRVPRHLEALVSANAAADRMGKKVTMSEAIASIHEDPSSEVNARILRDIGTVLGRTLLGPVAWLNPAEIVLTGSMARPELSGVLSEVISDSHPAVTKPKITVLEGEDNDLIRARGAALVVLRRHVFKNFDRILSDSDPADLISNVRRLTFRVKTPGRLGG